MYPLDSNSTIVGYMRRQRFLIKDRKMKKKKMMVEMETEEQKQARWAKQKKMAKSFAKQAGVSLSKKVKTQSEKYDY
jgi:hypothetical protein